jgi:hypothetical protein
VSGGAPYKGLLSQPADSYGERFQDHLLEQYKLYVESAQRKSERRLLSGNFFLAINSSLVAAFGLTLSSFGKHRWNVVMPLTGMLVSVVWLRVVKSYKDLNMAKFKVIHEMEGYLPVALFKHEWHVCGWGENTQKYRPVTHSEEWIPVAFMIFYLVLGFYAVSANVTP